MYIKQVIIEGFTSYKDQLIAEPFSPKINCIVGPNGSGKSNFFKAIRFVLNDAFAGAGTEERRNLLHEGAGHAVSSAYVEVVFDNSDGRFPLDRDEVRLRRTIGLKKDEFSIDRKHVPKSEVMNLLESAGFSRSNPYYVVQQGKIQEMARMTPGQRLELLKEVGGTKVYEERRRESMRIMAEAEGRRAEIEEFAASIEERLSQLAAERAELEAFTALDRRGRGIEYALLDRELTAARRELAQVDEERAKLRAETAAASEAAADATTALADAEARLAAARERAQGLSRATATAGQERQAALQARAAAEADVTDAAAALDSAEAAAHAAQAEVAQLEAQVAAATEQLEGARAALAAAKGAEKEAEGRLEDAKAQLQVLAAKQGSTSQFASQAERDAHLRKHIALLRAAAGSQQEQLASLSQQEEELSAALNDLAAELGDKQAAVARLAEGIAAADAAHAAARAARNAAADARKGCWRAMDEAAEAARRAEGEFGRAFEAWQRAVPRDVLEGLLASEELRRAHGLRGVAGCLVDLLDVPSQLVTAADVVAGNQLFQVVVESDAVGLELVRLLNKAGRGRVTFMPLNRLTVPDIAYPKQFGRDAEPLYRHLKCDARYAKAVQQVFGRFVVCKDRATLEAVAASGAGVDGITLDGDVLRRRGTVSGGYTAAARSKILTHKRYKELEGEVQAAKEARDAAQQAADQAGQDILALEAQLTAAEQHKLGLRKQLAQAKAAVSAAQADHAALEQRLAAVSSEHEAAALQLGDLQRQMRAAEAELASDMHADLTPAERAELDALTPRIEALRKELAAARKAKAQAQSQVTRLEARLATNLQRRLAELRGSADGTEPGADRAGLDALRAELARADTALQAAEGRLHKLEASADEAGKQIQELTASVQQLREAASRGAAAATEEGRAAAALDTRQAQLVARCDDLGRRIRDLGSLSVDAFEQYQGKSIKALHASLKAVQAELAGFGSVNRKALDQYTNFTEQRAELVRRRKEVEDADVKIRELISSLDMRKNEAIERTFKGVARHFRDVFAELVPGGRGDLVMQRRRPGEEGDEGEGEGEGEAEGDVAEKYGGITVRVSFAPGHDAVSLKLLSGGQKTLVALALIFAIQRCDPAPFYLFDEIDAALDPQYRTTVASLLRQQADDAHNPAMFIITTFHPQIVGVADKVYGVSHAARVSHIDVITRADAMTFLQTEEEQEAERAQQQAAQAPAPQGRGRRAAAG